MAAKANNSAAKILHNSIWFGLETVIETIIFLGSSIAVARYLGPNKLGYFTSLNFFVAVVTRTSGTGISMATRKYMSEFIALDRLGSARAVYNLAHRYQLIGAVFIASLGLAAVLLFGDPQFRLMACILMISIVPGLMSWVPAQANQAFQDVANNTLSAFAYLAAYTVIIVLTIHLKWDLAGVAAASLIGRTIEVFLRTIPLNRKLRTLPLDPLEPDLIHRVRRFCIQAVGLELLMSVVWDRSEMVFLRAFSTLEQTAFYSVSFTFATNLMVFPRVFGASTGITLMVEAVRDPKRVHNIVGNAARYLLLAGLPVSLGAIAITSPAIRFAYGARYAGAVPAMMVAALLLVPRLFQSIPETLIKSADRQNRILVWYGITGILNIALDFALIRRYGAAGAAWGNGLAQSFGVIVLWIEAKRFFDFTFPILSAVRLSFASAIMAFIAWFICHRIQGLPGLVLTVLTAIPVYILLVKLFRGLDPSDRLRLNPIGNRLPQPARRAYLATLAFVTPAEV